MKQISLLFAFTALIFVTTSCNQTAGDSQTSTSDSLNVAEKTFQKIDIKDVTTNAVSLFADNHFVVTAGQDSVFNQMTISWGALGNIWQHPSATIYIRSTRHTYELINNGKYFTLCAFDEAYRDKVMFIGSHSGRDTDKLKETGLTPLKTELGNMYYKEARLVIECEKVYSDNINPANILDEKARESYKSGEGEHTMFIGRILNVWEKR